MEASPEGQGKGRGKILKGNLKRAWTLDISWRLPLWNLR